MPQTAFCDKSRTLKKTKTKKNKKHCFLWSALYVDKYSFSQKGERCNTICLNYVNVNKDIFRPFMHMCDQIAVNMLAILMVYTCIGPAL